MDASLFHNYLRKLAESKGFSERGLSLKAGFGGTYLSSMRAKNGFPKINSLEAICETLDMTIPEFFAGMENKKPNVVSLTSRVERLAEEVSEECLLHLVQYANRISAGELESLDAALRHLTES